MRPASRIAGAIGILAVTILPLLAGCAGGSVIQRIVTGSGKLVTNTFDFSAFNRVEVSNAFEFEIKSSDSFSITVTTDDNVFEFVEVTKTGSTLFARIKPGIALIRSTQRIAITVPDLRAVTISGAVHGSVSGFTTDNSCDLSASGASAMELGDLKLGNTEFVVSGASRVTGEVEITDGSMVVSGASTLELNGSGQTVRIDDSGASSVRLAEFTVVNADVTVSGASNAAVSLSGRLDADVSGASG